MLISSLRLSTWAGWCGLLFLAFTVQAATITDLNTTENCAYSGTVQLPDGTPLRIRLALSDADRRQGLSGLDKDAFDTDQALLMVFLNYGERSIIMRDTRFDIDVFFLDRELLVIDLQRALKAHPGIEEPPTMQISRTVHARHILEMRADSRHAQAIQAGMRLQWKSLPTVKDIEMCMTEVWTREHGGNMKGMTLPQPR